MKKYYKKWKAESGKWKVRESIIIYLLTSSLYLLSANVEAQSLQEYQTLATEQNPGLQSKHKEFEAAMQRVAQSKGLPDPTLSISAFGQMTETRVGQQQARFTLTQMFPWFGTLRAQGDMSTALAEANFQRYLDERNKLNYQVAKAYYPLVELELLLAIQEQNLAVLESWKTLATANYENGKTSLADVLRVDLMIQEQRTEINLISQQKRPLSIVFNNLLNRSDTASIDVSDGLDPVIATAAIENDWNEHPLIQELQLKTEAKRRQSLVIEKQSLPKIGVGLDYIVVAERNDMNVPGNGKDAFMPMVSLSLPLYRKKYNAALKEVDLQMEAYEWMMEATKNELETSLENLKYDIQKENQLLQLYQNQTTETEQIQRLLLSEFSNSGKDLVELLRIQMQLLNYQKQQVKSKTKLSITLANVDYVLGSDN